MRISSDDVKIPKTKSAIRGGLFFWTCLDKKLCSPRLTYMYQSLFMRFKFLFFYVRWNTRSFRLIGIKKGKIVQLDCRSARRTRKTNLPMNQRGYDNSTTTVGMLSTRRIQICCDYFCKVNFWCLIFWNMWKQGPNKNSHGRFGFTLSNTLVPRSQSLLRCLGSTANWFFS